MTEQRERAEAIFTSALKKKFVYAEISDKLHETIIQFALDFHKQELQRIGEVYVAVTEKDSEEIGYQCEIAFAKGWIQSPDGWLKKLSLLEATGVLNQSETDERNATQQNPNQGDEAGNKKIPTLMVGEVKDVTGDTNVK